LKIGCDLLAGGRAHDVLVVAADDVVPALADVPGAPRAQVAGAGAILLSRRPSAHRIALCELLRHPAPGDALAAPALREPLRLRARGAVPGCSEAADDGVRFGLHPSGGLLRIVAALLRLQGVEP